MSDQYANPQATAMVDTKITVAALRSVLRDPRENLSLVKSAAERAKTDGARMLFAPELMLTGHGGHPSMADNAEPVPDGPLAQAVLAMSARLDIAICVGIAELDTSDLQIYNSQFVVDKGEYLGLQRKINLSGDEYVFFGPGREVPVFDLGGLRFGITICCALADAALLLTRPNECSPWSMVTSSWLPALAGSPPRVQLTGSMAQTTVRSRSWR
eukprot:SAG11_NODE_3934_length_2143_cov_1.548434_2_plen_214_part_00